MLIGNRLSGRYKILEMIGGGGMANVYLAHDMILDRDVAVKVLRLDFANDEEFIRRFHREAQSATSLAHPNIVNIFDVGEEDSIYYIVMEYVAGQTLKQYIQQHPSIQVEEVIDIMQQLTSAISHAHQNHIIHRDIKPHNILIDGNGNVKITDFGIAMALSATSITQTNSVLGSVHYLSPEQARGGMANRKSDIYSLGIVMFELLTGRLPFSGESAVSIALKHLQSETPSLRRWNPSIPQSVENIVLKATAKDPFHRYNSVDEMEEDLRTALDYSRLNEEKFVIPEDIEATKAIPIITDNRPYQNLDETIVHGKEQEVTNTPKDKPKNQDTGKKKRKKWPFILVSVFVAMIILAVLTLTVLPDLLAPDDIEVPDFTGSELEDAIDELEELGFTIGETIEANDEEIDAGLVIKTNPKAGKLVKEGTPVDIYVSIGKELFEMLDYTGRPYDEIVRLLEDYNFKEISKKEVHDDNVPVGSIIEQSVEKGMEVDPEETILEFTVSKGPEMIELKDLTAEYNRRAVEEYGQSVGLTIVFEKEEVFHETIEKGLVVSQNPPPKTLLKKGDKVTVVLSKGKEEIPPKTVTEEIVIPYDPVEEGEPQTVIIYIEDMNHSMTEPYETFEITEQVIRKIDFTIAHGEKAGYKVFRDNSVIIEKPVSYPGD
ncbi:Stk1 family PASTA domain-containing Ser/Thr kinase [Bacillus sp. 31A1R]|uniref:non-specific serine/threonine protein kinase n=1 Tax=Robertmurraya mangrovi TaxID=3098077 RepID=A0ABU5J4N3_9BACI|nr:Stk1 family PASTA domain-containing Ser/Thr kinase [Bacillus sp. 31A1R]MDZ5474388.1 Stk1 family PASTA domain-containing Ser/Thr kinase [Bacillus sp. 31A1R]